MPNRSPILEHTPQSARESFHCEVVRGRGYGARWHFHPEYQITLVLKSTGYRIVGDSIAALVPGDLVLVGSNLPHVWHQDSARDSSRRAVHAIVVRFREDFLGEHFLQSPELEPIRRLLRRSARGLEIRGRTRDAIATRLRELPAQSGFARLRSLLDLLDTLAHANDLRPIASAGFSPELRSSDPERMQRVLRFIHSGIGEPLARDEIARQAGLSAGAFSRFFKTRTGKTLPQYVNELRIGNACAQLLNAEAKVADIALACGFDNLANFNRQFRALTKMSPREYRTAFASNAV
jgi:AraC-like DNA-binding protein